MIVHMSSDEALGAGAADDKRIGLVIHPRNDVSGSLDRATRWAGAHGITVLGQVADAGRLPPGVAPVGDDEFADRVHGVLSLGGDGTMLGALRLVAARPVPVLGVNHGNLGFLTEVAPRELEEALSRLLAGEFSVEVRGALRVAADGDADELTAFNDMVLRTTGRGATAVDLTVGEDHFGRYRADALIVATPTGSTAYNYAAGGPVVSPSNHAMIVTPVAPMAGIGRTLVLGPDEPVVLRPEPGSPAELDADGAVRRPVPAGAQVRIDYVPDAAHIVRFDPARHARRNRVQLSLLDLPLRPDQLLDLVPADIRERHRLRAGGEAD
jgi:NAD+ kinase